MIELRDVTKQYPSGDSTLTVLHQISLTVQQGEFISIMGPSGSGKSTLMHIIGCLDTPTLGDYRLNGKPVHMLNPDELARIRNREIGFVFQNFFLLPRLSAVKNVELPLMYAGVPRLERRQAAQERLTAVGLGNRLHHLPNALSGGQKQRVAIARALSNRPSILLADEPTGALDSATGRDIMTLFQQLNATGVTIVVITHDRAVADVAERIVELRDGRIVHDGRRDLS